MPYSFFLVRTQIHTLLNIYFYSSKFGHQTSVTHLHLRLTHILVYMQMPFNICYLTIPLKLIEARFLCLSLI